MPVSKNRRKNGKTVKHNRAKRDRRLEDAPVGITLQDLINVVAYQEAHPEEAQKIEPHIQEEGSEVDIDFEDPDTQAVIRAVKTSSDKMKENEDGR